MEETLNQILNELRGMRSDINELKQGQNRLETGQEKLQKNIVSNLGSYTEKIIKHFDGKTDVLNKRVYQVETQVERLNQQ